MGLRSPIAALLATIGLITVGLSAPSASAAVLTPNGSTSTPPAPGKPCGNDLGLTVKFVPNKLDISDTAQAVASGPFTLTYTEISAPDPNQLIFGGVTSTVYGTDLLFTRVYLDTGNDGLAQVSSTTVSSTTRQLEVPSTHSVLAESTRFWSVSHWPLTSRRRSPLELLVRTLTDSALRAATGGQTQSPSRERSPSSGRVRRPLMRQCLPATTAR